MKPKEAWTMLGISRRHFYYNVDPELPRVYLGSAIRYDVRDLEALIARRTVVLTRVPKGRK